MPFYVLLCRHTPTLAPLSIGFLISCR